MSWLLPKRMQKDTPSAEHTFRRRNINFDRFGFSLFGKVQEQAFLLFYGKGSNGKSKLLETVRSVLGSQETGYSIALSPDVLIASRHSKCSAERATLKYKRLAITSETDSGQSFSEYTLKQLRSPDTISAKKHYQNPENFKPTHTMIIATNHLPEVRTGGDAFWRRIYLVPFNNVVSFENHHHLDAELLEEAPGILHWAIQGAVKYRKEDLVVPESVKSETSLYEQDQDKIGTFVGEYCEPDEEAKRVLRTDVYKNFRGFCGNPENPKPRHDLYGAIRELGASLSPTHAGIFISKAAAVLTAD